MSPALEDDELLLLLELELDELELLDELEEELEDELELDEPPSQALTHFHTCH